MSGSIQRVFVVLGGLVLLITTSVTRVRAAEYSVYRSWSDMDKATDSKYAAVTRLSGDVGYTGFWFFGAEQFDASNRYDSLDGTIMMETTVIRELIPHIDATYRTVATRDGRAVQGGSMGGMGSLKLAFKYPELFSSAVAFCPALLDADANMKRNPTLIPALFNGDKSLFTKDSPAAMVVTNADNIRGRLAIKIVIGSEDGLLEWSEKLHARMVKLKILHSNVATLRW